MSKIPVKTLLDALFTKGKIETTKSSAKTIVPLAERLISLAKRQTAASRRQMERFLSGTNTNKLFAEALEAFGEKSSGFVRLDHLPPRFSDGAPMCLVEILRLKKKE